jgi:hypothetical protein
MAGVKKQKGESERALQAFIDKFDSENQKQIRAVRRALRKRFPTAYELAYDNYNFFVIGYSPTERPSDALVSLVAGPKGVSVCFIHGSKLPDPRKILSGSGKQTRFIRVPSVDVFDRPEVEALFSAAVDRSRVPFRASGKPTLVIRSVSAKQRARRTNGDQGKKSPVSSSRPRRRSRPRST